MAYSPNRATDDDERILKAILGARKEEIDLYLRQLLVWVSATRRDAVHGIWPRYPERLHPSIMNFPSGIAEDFKQLSAQNDYLIAITELLEAVRSLDDALREFNDLRWVTTNGPQMDMLLGYFKESEGPNSLLSQTDPAREEAMRKHKIALLERAKTYGAETVGDLLDDAKYQSDLDDLLNTIRLNCDAADNASKVATNLTRRYELLLLTQPPKARS